MEIGKHPAEKLAKPARSVPTAKGPPATGVPEEHMSPIEIGGPKGLEPTRYGDWERRGRCIDF